MTRQRERRQRTRASLVQAANELFSQAGIEETTLEEVATHAGLHVQTLYRHFASKSELVTAVAQSYLDRFQQEFDRPERTEDTMALWRGWVERCALEVTRDGGERYRRRVRAFYADPAMSTTLVHIWAQYEDLLTRGLAADLGVSAEHDPLPRLVACMLWSANLNANRRWAHSDTAQSLSDVCVAAVDDVIVLFGDRLRQRGKRRAPKLEPRRRSGGRAASERTRERPGPKPGRRTDPHP